MLLVGVVIKRWVWLPCIGAVGVAVRRYIDILIIIITFPYSTCISSFFNSRSPTSLFIFKMFFSVLVYIIISKPVYFVPLLNFPTRVGTHYHLSHPDNHRGNTTEAQQPTPHGYRFPRQPRSHLGCHGNKRGGIAMQLCCPTELERGRLGATRPTKNVSTASPRPLFH